MLTRSATQAFLVLLHRLGFTEDVAYVESLVDLFHRPPCPPSPAVLAACRVLTVHGLCGLLARVQPELAGAVMRLALWHDLPEMEDLANTLLDEGVPASWTDRFGWTLLMAAADGPPTPPRLRLAQRLVAAGCPLDAVAPSDGSYALLIAFNCHNWPLVSWLLEAGAVVPPNSTGSAFLSRLPDMLYSDPASPYWCYLASCLAAAGADVNGPLGGLAPLQYLALAMGTSGFRVPAHFDLLEEYLALGADASALDPSYGRSAIYMMLAHAHQQALPGRGGLDVGGFQRAAGLLVGAGCDPNARTATGETALGLVVRQALTALQQPGGAAGEEGGEEEGEEGQQEQWEQDPGQQEEQEEQGEQQGPGQQQDAEQQQQQWEQEQWEQEGQQQQGQQEQWQPQGGGSSSGGVDWVGLLRALLEVGADASLPMFNVSGHTPLVMLVGEAVDQEAEGQRVADEVVELARLLAEAELQVTGQRAVRYGPELLSSWFSRLCLQHAGKNCAELSRSQLRMSEVMLRHCCPNPWPEDAPCKPTLFVSFVVKTSSANLLSLCLEQFPTRDLMWAKGSDGEFYPMLSFALGLALKRLEAVPEPDSQVALQEAHVLPVLHYWRQCGLFFRANVPPLHMVPFRSPEQWPQWAQDLVRFMMVSTTLVWHPVVHCNFPNAFRQAARTLMLINGCRGFGAPQQGQMARAWGRLVRRVTGRRPAARGVHLPSELLVHIIGLASSPYICWLPQLHPFLSPEEQHWVRSFLPQPLSLPSAGAGREAAGRRGSMS